MLWPTPDPLALGGRATLRYRAVRPTVDDPGRQVQARLCCRETLPTGQTIVASETTCPTRVLTSSRWFEAEVDLAVPLDALPTMSLAGHAVSWSLIVDDASADRPHEFPVVVAPVVAAAVLQGDPTP